MAAPSQTQIQNAKDNLANIYEMLDDVQLDFGQIMRNLIQLLSSPNQKDPGQGILGGIIAGMIDVFAIGAAGAGLPAAGPIAALTNLLYASITRNPPPDLHNQFASYSDRFVRNIHDLQGLLASYSGNVAAHWNDQITDPVDKGVYSLSTFGVADFVPSKTRNLKQYDDYRAQLRRASDIVSWKYFLPIVYNKGVRDDASPGKPSQYACHDCWASQASAKATFAHYVQRFPNAFFRIRSFSGKCSGNSGTRTTFDYWSLNTGSGAFSRSASTAVCNYVFIDNGLGKTLNPNGLAMREDVFLNWGLRENFIPGSTSYGANCQLVHQNAIVPEVSLPAALPEEGSEAPGPVTLAATRLQGGGEPPEAPGAIMSFAQLDDADLRKASFPGAEGDHVSAVSAHLEEADLSGASLPGADLRKANLARANLVGIDLGGADLRGANLSGASLRNGFLRGADLRDAVLEGCDLEGADLTSALGAEKLTSSDVVPARYRDATTPEAVDLSQVVDRVERLGEVCAASVDRELLAAVIGALPYRHQITYSHDLPLSGGEPMSLVAWGRGPAVATGIGAALEATGAEDMERERFLDRCRRLSWPPVGLRLSFLASGPQADPFITGPVGWPEIAAALREEGSPNAEPLAGVVDELDVPGIFLWGGRVATGEEEIALRLRSGGCSRVVEMARRAGVALEPLEIFPQESSEPGAVPALVFVRCGGGSMVPHLEVYHPLTSARALAPQKLDEGGKKRLRQLVELMRSGHVTLTAMHHVWVGDEGSVGRSTLAYA